MAYAITWEDPPPKKEMTSFAWFYRELKRNSGKWARYPATQSSAHQWCKNHPDYEYRSAAAENDERDVWMRHIPEAERT